MKFAALAILAILSCDAALAGDPVELSKPVYFYDDGDDSAASAMLEDTRASADGRERTSEVKTVCRNSTGQPISAGTSDTDLCLRRINQITGVIAASTTFKF